MQALIESATWVSAAVGAIGGLLIGAYMTFLTTERTLSQQRDIWVREQLIKAYSEAIYYLVKLSESSQEALDDPDNKVAQKDRRQHYSESHRYLCLLQAYQTGNRSGLATKLKEIVAGLPTLKNPTLPDVAADASDRVKNMFHTDDRVYGDKPLGRLSWFTPRRKNSGEN